MISTTLNSTFAALADPTRRAILTHLSRREASVLELAEPFQISLPAISRHLRVLENANLISRTRIGRLHRIRLNAAPLQDASKWIERYRVFWQQALDGLEEYLNEQEQQWNRKQLYKSEESFRRRAKKSTRRGRKKSSSANGSPRTKNSKR
jgi:DNA-binding transcriptional ArsR family regulator